MKMKKPFSTLSRLHRDKTGTSVLELAVILPVLLSMGFGAMEFGNIIYRQHLIVNGVRDAARYAASLRFQPANPTINDTKIKNIAVYGSDAAGTARVPGWLPAAVSVSFTIVANPDGACGGARCYRLQQDVPVVTVSTNFEYQPLGFLDFLGIAGPLNINASHQERIIEVQAS
jgi:TadE-like protein